LNISFGNSANPKTWTGPWITITHPQEIAKVIKEVNKAQYHQAHQTPFGLGEVANPVGRARDTPFADALIQGTITQPFPEHNLPEVERIMQTLARPYPIITQKATISDEEFVTTYRVARETTSLFPCGRHIGHYKAIVKHPALVSLHATMMSILFQVGIVPERWKQITDIMLEKNPRDSRCHQLWITALFERDLNHAKRVLIRRCLMHFLEDKKMLPEMQFGSRRGRQCPSTVLRKVFSNEYVRLLKQTAAFVENDAVGCFDRLVNNLILMVLKKLGLPSSIT